MAVLLATYASIIVRPPMPGHRTIILPATPLVLRQYAGPLWRGIPLAECGEADLPHPQLPSP